MAAILVASTVSVITGITSPASACVDQAAVNRGDSGFIPATAYLSTIAVAADDSIIMGSAGPRRLSNAGEELASYEGHTHGPGLVQQIFPLADGDVLMNRGVILRYEPDGTYTPGYAFFEGTHVHDFGADMLGNTAYVQPGTSTGAPTSLGEVRRRTPDGSLDPNFAGDGTSDVTLPTVENDPTLYPGIAGILPNAAGGVDLLALWGRTIPGVTLQFVRVAADGTVTELDRFVEPDLLRIEISEPFVSPEAWELLMISWSLDDPTVAQAQIIRVDLDTGAITNRRLPDFWRDLFRRAHLTRDRAGNVLASVGTAFSITNDSGIDPMLTDGTRGRWVQVLEPETTLSAEGIVGVGTLSTGEFVLGWHRPGTSTSGAHFFRGSASPGRFIDGSLSDQVTRLYRAALGRDPDAGGLAYWAGLRARGVSTADLAAQFLTGNEFQARFGNLDDRAFVTQLYLFVLGRNDDHDGAAYWEQQLRSGAVDRAAMLAFFADSIENIHRTDTLPPNPLDAELYRLYRAVFLRPPDVDGQCYWSGQRIAGLSLSDTANVFVSSPEFNSRYGDLDDRSFVMQLYANVLGRAADPDGLAYWIGQLSSGVTRGQVVLAFSESAEFLILTDSVPR